MKTNQLVLIMLAIFVSFLSGCELIQGIFKAGVWSGVLMVAVVIAIIVFIIMKIGKGRNG